MKKTAMITGASEGLGREFSRQLAAAGYLTINIARNESRLQHLVAELGEGHCYCVADLSQQEGISTCINLMLETPINLLVNNAGFSQFGVFREADINRQLSIFQVNCRAVMQLSHAFLRQAKRGDSLINLSSITYQLTTPVQPVYCATKCFIASFSESLWFQERARGVYVQALLPGITKTRFMERSSDIEGVKLKLLDAISQSPESVVGSSLKACRKKNGPVIVPGVHNKLLLLLLKLVPRKAVVWGMGKIGELA